jgi:hypothetical protein
MFNARYTQMSGDAQDSAVPRQTLTLRAVAKRLGLNAYGVLNLIAGGELEAQKVTNAAGGTSFQVFEDSAQSYLDRQATGAAQ